MFQNTTSGEVKKNKKNIEGKLKGLSSLKETLLQENKFFSDHFEVLSKQVGPIPLSTLPWCAAADFRCCVRQPRRDTGT